MLTEIGIMAGFYIHDEGQSLVTRFGTTYFPAPGCLAS